MFLYLPQGLHTTWGDAWPKRVVMVSGEEEESGFLGDEGALWSEPQLMDEEQAMACVERYREKFLADGYDRVDTIPAVIIIRYTVADRQRDYFRLKNLKGLMYLLKQCLEEENEAEKDERCYTPR